MNVSSDSSVVVSIVSNPTPQQIYFYHEVNVKSLLMPFFMLMIHFYIASEIIFFLCFVSLFLVCTEAFSFSFKPIHSCSSVTTKRPCAGSQRY